MKNKKRAIRGALIMLILYMASNILINILFLTSFIIGVIGGYIIRDIKNAIVIFSGFVFYGVLTSILSAWYHPLGPLIALLDVLFLVIGGAIGSVLSKHFHDEETSSGVTYPSQT